MNPLSKRFFMLLLLLLQANCFYLFADVHKGTTTFAGKTYEYEYVDNDPLKARIYTLSNGLKVYMSYYRDEPRVQTLIAVKAGSKNDPSDATGLAHYLEHMVFKGTDEFATKNWQVEKVMLDKISDLYELHRNTEELKKTAREMGRHLIPLTMDEKLTAWLNADTALSFMMNDTLTGISIPQDVVRAFIKANKISPDKFLSSTTGKPYKFKDGFTVNSPNFVIDSIRFGSFTLANVTAVVGNINTPVAMGKDLFKNFRGYNWNVAGNTLEIWQGTNYADVNPDSKMDTVDFMKQYVYHMIDSISGEAAKYAIANEYDKMINAIGAKGTNAYTSEDRTVYINDIPGNELERWMIVESNRFKKLVLRLFHTELEAVYEEFNRGQDNDFVKTFEAMASALFKKHTYGTQTTIGKGEHLKNPSMVKIHEYFNNYYVPNNVAICISGDFEMDRTIFMIDKYFGDWKTKEVKPYTFQPEEPITQPIVKEVYGRQQEFVAMAYRFGGAGTRDGMMIDLVNQLLYNERAGLMDLNLMQSQKVLNIAAFTDQLRDYSTHTFIGFAREGQKLEEVKDLLLGQIEKLKKGEFDEWLLKAVVNNMRLEQMKNYEKNWNRAHDFVEAFTEGVNWQDFVNRMNEMEKVTKQEIVDFVKKNYGNNYVVVYKRLGEDKNAYKVAKPKITPVTVDRDAQSEFSKKLKDVQTLRFTPKFLDFNYAVTNYRLINQVELYYLKNDENNIFTMYYILDMGTDNNKMIELAIKYLPFLGTQKYTAAQLQQEFYKLGVNIDVNTSRDRVYITASGLDQNLVAAIQLFEHFLEDVVPDPQAFSDMVDGILKERADAKLDKNTILREALFNYGMHGVKNPFTNIFPESELKGISAEMLVEMIKKLNMFKHRLFYYGPRDPLEVVKIVNEHHRSTPKFIMYPPPVKYEELSQDKETVYFADYDMVQSEFMLLSKVKPFDKSLMPHLYLYNEYFGRGLSSIVFQEIREAKALAYSAYASFTAPRYADKSHYITSYVGTQVDKFREASAAMREILDNMPASEKPFNAAKEAVLKQIESERITKTEIFWEYEKVRKLGLNYDIRKDVYETVKNMTLNDLVKFQQENIKGKKYTYLVIGKKDRIDMNALNKIGEVKILSLQEIFNY